MVEVDTSVTVKGFKWTISIKSVGIEEREKGNQIEVAGIWTKINSPPITKEEENGNRSTKGKRKTKTCIKKGKDCTTK